MAGKADPYMECDIYARHGACSCSTGVPGNVCPLAAVSLAGKDESDSAAQTAERGE